MIWTVFKKEILDSLRDYRTVILGVLVPIIVMFAMTLFIENVAVKTPRIDSIQTAVSSEMPEEAAGLLSQIPHLIIEKTNNPIQSVAEGKQQIAIEVESDFKQKWTEANPVQINLYADQSSLKTAQAVEYIRNQLHDLQKRIVNDRLQSKGISAEWIEPFHIEVKKLSLKNDQSLGIFSNLIPLIVMMSIMLGAFPSAIDLFAGEKERKTMESLLITPVPRLQLILGKFLTITAIGMFSGFATIISFMLLVKLFTVHLSNALNIQDHISITLLISVFVIVLFSALFSAMAIVVSLFAKTFKEAQTYFAPLMMVVLVPYLHLLGTGPNEIPQGSFLVPIYNVFALLKVIVYGVPSFMMFIEVCFSTIAAMALIFALANWMYRKDRWVLGKQ